jgi:integrase/recombinase XerC
MAFTSFIAYLTLEKKYSPHTIAAYKKDLKTFQEFCALEYEQQDLVSVNYAQIRSWIVGLVANGIANSSVNRKVASLKAYYKFLLKTKQLEVSPLAKHQALKTAKKVQLPFSEKEMELVLTDDFFEDSFEGLRDRLIVELLYSTGMRRAELIGLKTFDVDYKNKTIKVLGKRNKERYIPLMPSLIDVLQQYDNERLKVVTAAGGDYLLLTKKGLKIYDTLVYRLINDYFSRASTKVKKSPHILRHTFATHMLNQGADLNAVKELLGHASLASTQVYTHNSMAELKKVYANSHPRNEDK